MSYRAIYAYPWDLADEGLQSVVREIEALGLNTITIAGSYHAGKFLRPHGRNGRVYFPEDGTVYFKADPSRYGAIRPVLNSLVGEHDIFREMAACNRIAANAWMVLLHNSRLGGLHPQWTVENAFGDRYVYNLCPSVPEVREYAVALCRDITDACAVTGISIETPGFMPFAHGYHHEFAMVKPNRWLDARLGLCFCSHCVGNAEADGIRAARLKTQVRDEIDRYLAGAADWPDDMAEAFWLGDTAAGGELSAFLRWRSGVVTSLVREIRAAVRTDATVAVIPSVARPSAGAWYEGSDLRALAEAAGHIEACFYEPTAERVRADVADVQRRIEGTGTLRGILRPGFPDLQSRGELVAAAGALRDGRITDVAFYNYGHLPRRNLAWIADALAGLGG
jgi:hypothetical protein